MEKIVVKRVSMLELFYDLIFVFAISRITMMIHHPLNGMVPIKGYAEFIIVIIFVMQVWLYQTVYINRFGTSRMIDIAGLLISMFAAVYLANNINTEWSKTFYTFNISISLTVANLIGQFWLGSTKHPWRDPDTRAFLITLFLELGFSITGLLIGYHYGIYLCIIGGLIGFLMPCAIYRMFKPTQVNFPHLVERLSLIIIVTFGETLVNITQYFKGNIWSPTAIVLFVGVASLFGVYTLLVENFINHHQHTRGFIAMYSHVALIISILSITVSIIYMTDEEVSRMFLSSFFVVNLVTFYICLGIYGIYNRKSLRFDLRDYVTMSVILIFGCIALIISQQNNLALLIVFMLINIGEFIYLTGKLKRVKK